VFARKVREIFLNARELREFGYSAYEPSWMGKGSMEVLPSCVDHRILDSGVEYAK